MKKVCLFLILILLAACGIQGASAQSRDTTLIMTDIKASEYAGAVCWVGDTLYILGQEGVYRWQTGQSTLETVIDLSGSGNYRYQEQPPVDEAGKAAWEKAVQHLFTDGAQLYAVQPYSGQIYLVKGNCLEALASLPAERLYTYGDGQSMFRGIRDIAWAEGALYLLLGTDDPELWDKTELFRFDIASGEMTPCSPEGIQNVHAGPAGKLLLSIIPKRTEDSNSLAAGIWQYDIASGTLEKQIMAYEPDVIGSSMLYREQDQSIFYVKSGEIIAMDEKGQSQVKAYLPVSAYGSALKASVSPSGLYAYASGKYIFIRDLMANGFSEQTVIRLMGNINPELAIQFSIANPDIALIPLQGDVRQSVLTVDPQIDLYIVSAPGIYAAMKEKGYAAEMNQDTKVVEMAKRLYPAIQDTIFAGEKLLAYPLTLMPESWTVNETLWQEFGFGTHPYTYKELFKYLALWNEEYAQAYPDYMFLDTQQDITGYVTMIVKEYILQHETADTPLSFDSAEFRGAISDVIAYRADLKSNMEMYGMPVLFSYYQGFGVGSNDDEKTVMMLPPALSISETQAIGVKAELLVVNKASKKQEQALRFVEFCINNNDITFQYMMDPSLSDPVRPVNYQEYLNTLQSELTQLQESINDAGEEQKDTILEAINSKQAVIKNIEDSYWLISRESIDNYRSVARYMRIPYTSAFLTEDENSGLAALQPIIERYCTQGLSNDAVDRFIGELDRVSQMIHAEGR